MENQFSKNIINKAPFGYAYHKIVLDKKGEVIDYIFLDINKTFEKFTGLKGDDIINKRITEVLPNIRKDEFDWVQEYGEVALKGGFKNFEQYSELLKKHFQITVYSLEKNHFVTVFTDITELKNARDEIYRSKILLESALESPKGIIILSLDREYRYLYFNKNHADAMAHVYGANPKIGDCIFDLMKNNDDIGKVKAHYDKAMAGEGHMAIDTYGESPNQFYYEVRYNPIYDERNQIIGVTAFAQDVTERKQAEENLIKEKIKSQQYLDIAEVMLIGLERDGTLILANHKACAILGYSEDELEGKNWFDNFIPERLRKRTKEVAKKVYEGDIDPVKYHENEIITKSGEEKLIAWNNSILKDESGNIIGTLSSGEDITDKKRIEEDMKKLNFTLESAQKMSKVGYWSFDIDSQIPTWSDIMFEVCGYKKEDGVPSYADHKNTWHPDDWEMFDKAVEECTKGKPYNIIVRILFPDGTYHHVKTHGQPVYDHNNEIKELVGISQDITEIIELKATVKESILTMVEVEKVAKIGSWKLDPKLLKVKWSDEMYNIFGIDRNNEEKLLEIGSDKIHPADKQRIWDESSNAVKEGVAYELEYRIILSDGKIKNVINIGQPLTNEQGEVISYIGIVQDTTEQKKAEKELNAHREKLEKLVAERTKELEEKNSVLQRFYDATIDREFRIKELQDEIEKLKKEKS